MPALMKVIVFGATGMVGQGVLRECLLDPGVEAVLAVGRTATGQRDPKFRELIHSDMFDYAGIESELAGYDACFFCLGISSVGMKEDAYRRITYDITLSAARTLARLNPAMTFIYVSGEGTDSTEKGSRMWARVKGQTENALLQLPAPFKAVMFRPGGIEPGRGITSKTKLYRVAYSLSRPLWPLLRKFSPNMVTTSEKVGRAMLRVARSGAPKPILDTRDINAL
jgi:uncharacterized protein YbjT (DUF2867 family)